MGSKDTTAQSSSRGREIRDEYIGGLSVIRFLYHSSILIAPHRALSEGAKNRVISALQGMKIRNAYGKRDKKFTFHGLTSDMTQDFLVFVEDGDEQFELKYKKLPYLDLGVSADGRPIYLPIECCVIYSKDNKSNQRLRRLVSQNEIPPDLEYPKNARPVSKIPQKQTDLLEEKWQLVVVGQNDLPDAVVKFSESIEINCGKPIHAIDIEISNAEEVKENLNTAIAGTKILVCVMDKQDKPLERALKREAELEKGILTQFCKLEDVEHYCDLYRKNNDYNDLYELAGSWYVTNLVQEMIAKTGAYKDKTFLPHSAFPPRFKCRKPNCVVMYFGCKVINYSFTHLTVIVANISRSDRSTSDYVSRVALGNHMQNLPALFGELLQKYSDKADTDHTDLPDRIILFREGFVGGRIEEMFRKEVDAVREKLDSLKDVRVYPLITFIVCDRKSGSRSVNVGDGKANYNIFSDENAICCSEFETLIRNLSYSRRYPKPLPLYYANRAARLAKVYLEGEMNPDANKMDKIAETIDRSLYVRGDHQNAERQNQNVERQNQNAEQQQDQNRAAEQQQDQEMQE